MRRLTPWLPELALLLFGFVLRATMVSRFDPTHGYDFISHWKYLEWMRAEHSLPDAFYSRSTYQPPLYYAAVTALLDRGMSTARIGTLSVLAGCLRLVLLEIGLVAIFRDRRLLRCAALAVAVVLPASVHLDGMINPESWLGLFSAGLALCAYLALVSDGRARFGWWIGAGICAALALMTKISVTMVIAAVATAALVDVVRNAGGLRARLMRLAPVAVALAIVAASTGWYFARNVRLYGKALLTGYDFRERSAAAAFDHVPLWKRRSPGYLVGWTADIYRRPTWPAGYQPVPRFFPLLVASTFADYYRYAYAPPAAPGEWTHELSAMPTHTAWNLSRASIAAGTLIAACTVAAWFGALIFVWRRRASGLLALVLVPLFGLAGQLLFAWRYPVDWEGPVKGVYVQFAALPLCALFGVAVDWLWRRKIVGRALAALALFAVAVVTVYTVYSRFASPPFRWPTSPPVSSVVGNNQCSVET